VRKLNKKILIPTLALAAITGLGVLGVTSVKADEDRPCPPIVETLIEKFNLNEDEVSSVLDEVRQERQGQMQQNREERLNQAVSDGVITEEQKELIQTRWQEMFAEREQERQAHREEMQAWFEENGIDHDALMEFGGFGPRGGFGQRGFGPR
jgi:hypothetical protein